MQDLNSDYITVKQYVEYLKKNSINNTTISKANYRLKEALMVNEFDDNVIEINGVKYIKKDYFEDSIELYKKSIGINIATKKIIEYWGEEINSFRNISRIIEKKCNAYLITLINRRNYYISKDNFDLILKGIDEIKIKKCITRSRFSNIINNTFAGIEYVGLPKYGVIDFLRENKLEFVDNYFIGNFYPNNEYLYPKDTVDKVMEHLNDYIKTKKVKLLNIKFKEYLALNKNDFENKYKVLEKGDFLSLKEPYNNTKHYSTIYSIFKDTNIKVIWIHKGETYISKKEFKEYMFFRNGYVVAKLYFNNLGIKFYAKIARNKGIEIMKYKQHSYIKKVDIDRYIKKVDIDRYINVSEYKSEFNGSNSLYDRVRFKIEYYPNKNENKYPKLKEYIMDFTKHTNKSVNTMQYAHPIYRIYNILLDNMTKDLESKNEAENNRLFSKVIRIVYQSQNRRKMLIQFINYLIYNRYFKLNKIIDVKEKGNKEAYTKEQFITLLSKLLEIVDDENNLKKIYRNWNISSAVSYVFMHYCLAWRKMDLVSQLPMPNLNLISTDITDGESFIRWLENGNKITYEMAKDICKSLEEETERLRKKAHKNNVKLSCIISDALMNEVAILLCINEANRQIHSYKYKRTRYKDRCFNEGYIRHKNIQMLFKENFDIDVEKILDGIFDNIRMNKGFLTLVKEKAEELNLFAYHYAEVLRGHKPKAGALSETTKIYLDKDVARASVIAFATGTMGSVAYTLLQLVDKGFEDKSDIERIEAIQNLNMTPYTIEISLKVMSNKIAAIKNEIQKFFKQGGYKKSFLQELLYGENSYGIEEKTKCLIKIIKKEELGITRIKSMNYSDEKAPNKWCPFNRRSCIGCEYMIALRYFIYEFEKKFNQVLDDLEDAISPLDKEIAIESINELYIPVLNDLGIILGSEEVYKVINTKRYKKLTETI